MPFVSPNHKDEQYNLQSVPKPVVRKPMPNPRAVSPVIVRNSIRAAATPGSGVTRTSLLGFVSSGMVLSYGDNGAAYEKEKPGLYVVNIYLEGTLVDQHQVASTAEAKSLVVEHLVNCAEQEIAKEKQNA
jgi:hypothetical protein